MASTASGPLSEMVAAISLALAERLPVGDDVADQADAPGLVGGDVLAGEQENFW